MSDNYEGARGMTAKERAYSQGYGALNQWAGGVKLGEPVELEPLKPTLFQRVKAWWRK